MSVLSYWESDVTITNITAGTDMVWRNYVVVTLCITWSVSTVVAWNSLPVDLRVSSFTVSQTLNSSVVVLPELAHLRTVFCAVQMRSLLLLLLTGLIINILKVSDKDAICCIRHSWTAWHWCVTQSQQRCEKAHSFLCIVCFVYVGHMYCMYVLWLCVCVGLLYCYFGEIQTGLCSLLKRRRKMTIDDDRCIEMLWFFDQTVWDVKNDGNVS